MAQTIESSAPLHSAPPGSFVPADQKSSQPGPLGCAGGYCFGTLPDLVEPATNSNHRQFFHRVVIAVAIGYGLYRLYRWDPETPFKQIVRILALLAGGAYLVHLGMDATTRRSLLWVGLLN
jgi:hypothetical protein